MKRKRYVFQAGRRKVTVWATSLEQARGRAISALDRRIRAAYGEPPVGYDLVLSPASVNLGAPRKSAIEVIRDNRGK